jgi:Protein of unknown function (DUF1416)
MCGAPAQGARTQSGIDATKETVIEGQVVRDGEPVPSAFVRLLDSGGEFTAEVVSSDSGDFRFFAAPGSWTVRALAPGGVAGEQTVEADTGITTVHLELAAT